MSPTRAKTPPAAVAYVGTGPGDPGLLGVRAAELLAALTASSVVMADARVPDEVLARIAQGVEIVRTPPGHSVAAQVVATAREGRPVVRLLPDDAWSTGGSDEVEVVLKAKLRLELVPGVAAATAVPAYAGLAAGAVTTTVRLAENPDWRTVAAAPGTLVLVGGVQDAAKAASALVEHGRKAEAPASVTAGGTGPQQRTVRTTLDALDRDVSAAGLAGEVVVVVGGPVKKAGKLDWYEDRPLYGWRVLVPRTRDQAGVLSQALRAHGALPVEVPTIAVEPPRTPAPMERAVKGLVTGRYQWVAFTSVNAVRAVREKLDELSLDARSLAGVKVAAVGEATAAALVEFGVRPDLVPSGPQSSEGLLADWAPYDEVFDPLDRVLLPRADIATDTLLAGLKELGWAVDDVTAYRTVRAAPPPAATREALKGGGFDAVLFTSSSTVRNLVGIAGKPHDVTVLACIGPATAATATELGLRVDVLSPKPDVATLVEALAAFAAQRGGDLPSAARRKRAARP